MYIDGDFFMAYGDILGDNYRYDPTYHRFADVLGIDKFKRDNLPVAQKLEYIYEWARHKTKSDDFGKIAKTVHELRRNMGLNVQGEMLTNSLYQWIRLDDTGRQLKQKEQERTSNEILWNKQKDGLREKGKVWKSTMENIDKHIAKDKENTQLSIQKEMDTYKSNLPKDRRMSVKEIDSRLPSNPEEV